jgi:lysophospholipase L1-like esterase
VLKRLSEVTARKPKKIFLMIGINDIIEKVPLDDICSNYEKIIQGIKGSSPATKLYIQSALPVILRKSGEAANDSIHQYTESWLTSTASLNKLVNEYNKQLKLLSEKYHLAYIDLHPHFLKDGAMNRELTYDGIHLARNGYILWQQQVSKYIEE